eukprot:3146701-Alexandrium_andersonii.AAC.1
MADCALSPAGTVEEEGPGVLRSGCPRHLVGRDCASADRTAFGEEPDALQQQARHEPEADN